MGLYIEELNYVVNDKSPYPESTLDTRESRMVGDLRDEPSDFPYSLNSPGFTGGFVRVLGLGEKADRRGKAIYRYGRKVSKAVSVPAETLFVCFEGYRRIRG